MEIQKIKEDYLQLGLDIKFNSNTKSYNFLLENRQVIQKYFEEEIFVKVGLKDNILDKWFFYRSLGLIENLSQNMINEIIISTIGINNKFHFLNPLFKHLVRLSSYFEVMTFILNKIESRQSTLEMYYYLDILKLVEIPDLITYDSEVIKIDSKASYRWDNNSYTLDYLPINNQELRSYEFNVNKVTVRKYEIILHAFKNFQDSIEFKEVCRFMFPRDENCPRHLKELYRSCLEIY